MVRIEEIRYIDFAQWAAMYRKYAEFYNVTISDETAHTVWGWLGAYENEMRGLVALVDDEPAGIVHYRRYLRSMVGKVGIFLDDIYVDENFRRHGVAKALFEEIQKIAKAQNISVIRWITADYNKEAQEFYNSVGHKTGWLTYEQIISEDEKNYERK